MIVFALVAALLTYAIGIIGNHVYFDPRPFVVGHFIPLIPHAPDNGFPSDHVLLVSAIASIGMFWNRRLGVVLWILAIIVAIARVWVGVHHPIDVLGSITISLLTVSAVYVGWKRGVFRSITTRL